MSTIRAFIRAVNKNKAEQPISVVWQSKSEKFVVSSGQFIDPNLFKKERAFGDSALLINSLLTQIKADLELAEGLLKKNGHEPTSKLMRQQYQAVTEERRNGTIPKPHVYTQALGMELDDSKLLILEEELEARLKKVKRMRSTFMVPKDDLFLTRLDAVIEQKRGNHSTSTREIYQWVYKKVYEFNPLLSIHDVTADTLYELQNFLVRSGMKNSSIKTCLLKVMTVMHTYQIELNLSPSWKKFKLTLPKKEENIIYFEQNELLELIHFGSTNVSLNRARDLMVLMCSTGLRFSDIFFNGKECIKDGVISLTTQKTKQYVTIPLAPISKDIMERHDYQLKPITLVNFRKAIRKVCKQLPSLQYEETITSFNGLNRVSETKPKWQFICSHAGRRTFINLCIEAGIPFSKITAITGHANWKTFALYTDKKRKLDDELFKVKVFG
ncbi:tyrosine-type recombinase/integrase [Hymenobacter monticola]|uniref:Phage integrase SAM-like domain-containing protein n=1 Tax=Hymenobacter monticola TaxID=1705399 RepID=A0ABY4B825_9BACT|nr:tyrosine-type recombinase/integrase [Hymenobacter monticola]UOE32830.1 phage integrase SAM-like domain-containing protein [Hymenobacter monticola]